MRIFRQLVALFETEEEKAARIVREAEAERELRAYELAREQETLERQRKDEERRERREAVRREWDNLSNLDKAQYHFETQTWNDNKHVEKAIYYVLRELVERLK